MLDRLHDVDMIEPIRLRQADIIYEGKEGIVFHELRSDALMVSMIDTDKFKEIYENNHLDRFELWNVKQKAIADVLVHDYHKVLQFACYQAMYDKKELIDIDERKGIHIQSLSLKYAQDVIDAYQHNEPDYIYELIRKKHLWGLFENQQLAGFIGIHDEGSMGLLEVLPQYRRKGYGMMLESYLINEYLKQGLVPYCQVIDGNEKSLKLQQKLGLTISNQLSYWLF